MHRHAFRVVDLDFFVDVLVSGAVLGVGLTDSPDNVARVLGGDFAEDRNRAVMRRDYGLVEFSWARWPGSDSWHATGFTVQAHRLASITVAEAFVHRYGPFGRHLRFTRVNAELDRLGYHLQEITDQADAGYRRYWLAESCISLLVATSGYQEFIDAGDVWSISDRIRPSLSRPGASARNAKPSRTGWSTCSGSTNTGASSGLTAANRHRSNESTGGCTCSWESIRACETSRAGRRIGRS